MAKNLQTKMQELEKELNGKYINRSEVIHGLMVTLLARGNCVLLGSAGTGKSDLVQTLSRAINGTCFETILTKTSAPEELFGAYDIKELQEGNYVRNTKNSLVDGDVAFVDEVFKCNSATLNGLLGVMAQRTFRNGSSAPTPIPLQLFVGASNEMPEGGAEGQLAALWDRFEMRFVVEYIKDKGSFHKLLSLNKSQEPKTKVDVSDIIKAMNEINDIELGDAEELIVNLWDAFNKNGFRISDRKWRNSLRYMKANAWLNGRTSLTDDDVMVIKDMAWQTPDQIKPIRKLVFNTLNPALGKAQDLYDAVCEVFAELEAYTDDDVQNKSKFGSTRGMKAAEVNNKLVSARKMIQTTIAQQKGKDVTTLNSYVESINTMVQGVTNILLGNI